MSEHVPPTTRPDDAEPVSGKMLLYQRPQLLAHEDHGDLGLKLMDAPFEFASQVRAIPLVVGEFSSAQKHYPIVFHGAPDAMPYALVGLGEDRNLFVEADGRWSVPGYIPAYLRCYPFALATAAEDRYAVVFDRDAPMVSADPDVAFFEGTKISDAVQERIELCRDYEAEKQRTRELMETLGRLELLTPQQVTRSVDGKELVLARYLVVASDKLRALDAGTINELFHDGSLAALLAHLFSLDNFSELLRRSQDGAP